MVPGGGSAAPDAEPQGACAGLADGRVLRLCSVFEPRELLPFGPGYDVIGGMQNHTAELTRCLDRMGVRQVVLTSRLNARSGRAPLGRNSVVVRVGVPMPLLRQAWALLAAWQAVACRGPVTVVHAHCGEDVAVLPLARLAALRHRCPLVVTVHTSVRHTMRVTSARTALLRLAGGIAERGGLRRADAVIVLSKSAAAAMRQDGLAADRVRVIPPGYDPEQFAAPASDPFPALNRPLVGYIGRLAPQKDVGTLIEAFGQVPGPACLLIAGDGPDRPAAERQARLLGDRVHFTGFLPHATIPAVLQHIDVLVLATRYEELPSVLVEAMAAGVPVIASRVGGIPDLIEHDVNGLLVSPADVAGLASAITRVLSEPQTAARLAAAGRRTAQAYAWPALARRVASVYREVSDARQRSA